MAEAEIISIGVEIFSNGVEILSGGLRIFREGLRLFQGGGCDFFGRDEKISKGFEKLQGCSEIFKVVVKFQEVSRMFYGVLRIFFGRAPKIFSLKGLTIFPVC